MVTTRTQSGAITVKNYDYKSSNTQGEASAPPPKRQRRGGRQLSPPPLPLDSSDSSPSNSSSKSSSSSSESSPDHSPERQLSPVELEGEPAVQEPALRAENFSQGVSGFPPVTFGEKEPEGLSAIQRADRDIQRWEGVLNWHEENLEEVVPMIQARLEEARDVRAALEDNDVNNAVGHPKRDKIEVEKRITVLQEILSTSENDAERENIRTAINGYQSKEIPFSTQYTTIWAGQVIERFDTYADFTADRTALLDRYVRDYGYGWLWWEPPLDIRTDEQVQMQRCAELLREIQSTGMGHYRIRQGFWKRFDYVARLPFVKDAFNDVPDVHSKFWKKTEAGEVFCQQQGPRLVFQSLLDSGASYPSLYRRDIEDLGIDSIHYAAQSAVTTMTANGSINTRLFELYVSIVDHMGNDLVEKNNPMAPGLPDYLGSLCPVLFTADDTPTIGSDGTEENLRLSGMIPFLACYVSAVPTRNIFCLGEDRNDVLGAHKMPGQTRWDISAPSTIDPGYNSWPSYRNPHITFRHRNDAIVDMDGNQRFTSRVVVLDGSTVRVSLRDPGNRNPVFPS